MKTIFTLTLFTTVLTISAIAQPSFTTLPVPVDKQKETRAEIDYSGVDPKNTGGSNRTWDYSNLDLSTATVVTSTAHTDVSGSPHASSFPQATFYTSSDDGSEDYFQNQASSYTSIGSYYGSPENYLTTYSNPETIYSVPFNYNDTQTDTYASSFNLGSNNGTLNGSSTMIFDGYGTLILDIGTFTNIARFKMILAETEVFTYLGTPSTTTTYDVKDTAYIWIRPGDIDPLMEIDYFYIHNEDGIEDESGTKLTVVTSAVNTGISGSTSYLQANLFPQPASSAVTVTAKSLQGNCLVNISNLNGESVAREEQEASNETLTLNVQSLKSGLYVLEIQNEDRLYRQKLVIK